MTESDLTKRFIEALRRTMPGAVVFKHADAWTAGIPDLTVSWRGVTTWVEVKKLPYRARGIQRVRVQQLGRVARVFYVMYDVEKKAVVVITPERFERGETAEFVADFSGGHRAVADFIAFTHHQTWPLLPAILAARQALSADFRPALEGAR